MTSEAQKLIDVILENEGGYVNDPDDPGGETNFGISKRSYPDLIIPKLTKQDASDIYFADYYMALKCAELPNGLAMHVLDHGVNAGLASAREILGVAVKATEGMVPMGHIFVCLFYADRRKRFYKQIGTGKLEKYLRGWLNRVDRVQDIIESGELA